MKKRIVSLILAVAMLSAVIPATLIITGAIGYYGGNNANDLAYSVYYHGETINVDARCDEVYLASHMISEKHVVGTDSGFDAYISATSAGLYLYAEIEDHTVGYEYMKYNTETNKIGNHDKLQFYFTDASAKINYIQLDYYANNVDGETYTQEAGLPALTHVHTRDVTVASCKYATRILRDEYGNAYGWVAEIFVPWSAATTFSDNLSASSAPYACSVGIQANNDTWTSDGKRPSAMRHYCYSNYIRTDWWASGSNNSSTQYIPLTYTTYAPEQRDLYVTGEHIELDGQLDSAYLESTRLADNGNKWSGSKRQIKFTAYARGTLKGLYFWIETDDATMNNVHDTNAEQGDMVQIYLDWTENYLSHEITGKKVDEYRHNDAGFYGGWYAFDYEGNIAVTNDISALKSEVEIAVVKYENPDWDGEDLTKQYMGYAVEGFIPWNERMLDQIGAHSSNIHLGIGFAVSDDETYNYNDANITDSTEKTHKGDYRTSIAFDTNKGVSYYNHYEWLPDYNLVYSEGLPYYGELIADKVDSVKVDGLNTNGEYDNSTVVHVDKKGGGVADEGDIYRIAVTDDAVYILLESIDSTPSTAAAKLGSYQDYMDLGISFGGRFAAMLNLYRIESGVSYAVVDNKERWYNYGAISFTEGKTIASISTADKWTYELMIPLTAEDKAKIEKGSFDLAIGAMMLDGTATGRNYKYDNTLTSVYTGAGEINKFNHFRIGENTAENEITGASVALGDSINVRYYADVAMEDLLLTGVRFTHNGKIYWASPEKTETDGIYAFTFKGLAPQCIGDNIKAELCIDGTVVSVKENYSVLENLKNTKKKHPETETLVNSLLHYCTAAQNYANYKTDTPLNAGLDTPVYETVVNFDMAIGTENISGARFSAAGVYHASENKLYAKVTLTSADPKKMTATVNGKNAGFELYSAENNEYIVYSEGIKATEFDRIYTFVISDGTNTQTLTYSVNAYCASKQNAENTKTAELSRAMYAYGKAAEEYAKLTGAEYDDDSFEKYRSNIAYGTGNNSMMYGANSQTEIATYRAVFPVEEYGRFDYKLYFSNNEDSSSSGFSSYPDMTVADYKIHYAALRTTTDIKGLTNLSSPTVLTFDGKETRVVKAGERFWSDEVSFSVPRGSYLVYEWTVEYTRIPSTIVASTYYTYKANTTADKFPQNPSSVSKMPLPDLIGCTRDGIRLTFIGDSITMGTGSGAYQNAFWVKQLSDRLGTGYCVWNLGLDSGRANDVVRGTSWKEKLKHTDILSICLGVNDIGSIFSGTSNKGAASTAESVLDSIKQIAEMGENAGADIILFSVPPFNFTGTNLTKWNNINKGIKELAAEKGYKFFDFAAVLGDPNDPSKYIYGDHPNKAGCTAVADAFMAQKILEPIKSDFEIYQSNSITPTASNYALKSNGAAVTKTFRGIFKIQEYGTLEYKFHFSNNVNSTFSNGSYSYRNMPTESYKVLSAKVGTTTNADGKGTISGVKTLTFDGQKTRDVAGGEEFWSDALNVNVPEGSWLVFEWTVQYTVIAATNSENYAATFLDCTSGTPTLTDAAPMPILVGAKRGNSLRLGFIGDSITMGIVTGAPRAYEGWAAKIAAGLGNSVSAWNLGLGYARANDAANSQAWVDKAKQNDVVVICFGVNDINSGPYGISGQRTAGQIRDDIKKIAAEISDAGAEVIIFSTPPYTYGNAAKIAVWQELTVLLKNLAAEKGYKFFDFASYLWKADDHTQPAYGGHPNATGCTVVADAFLKSGLIKASGK